jgi:exonuclease SbcD
MFYSFLNKAIKAQPDLQIIITAGNHDSAARLESPKPLLESSNIHIVGIVEKNEDGNINYDKLVIPLRDNKGEIICWCMAVPFLRMGDYPMVQDAQNPYAAGVAKLYADAYQYVCQKKQNGQAVICMGHLHAQQSETGDMDKVERQIMGGVECISAAAFHEDICYVALGHIHKAQRLGGKDHIRYCGSPLPMSFSELNYKHQVITFELQDGKVNNIQAVEIPVAVKLQSVPQQHATIETVLLELSKLPDADLNKETAPFLEVRVLDDRPDPSRRHKIEQAIIGKHVRLAAIQVKSLATQQAEQVPIDMHQKLDELQPNDIFSNIYQATYGSTVPDEMLQLFNQVTQEVAQSEEA